MMAIMAIEKNTSIAIDGILVIDGTTIGVEDRFTGTFTDLKGLLKEFADKDVNIRISNKHRYESADK